MLLVCRVFIVLVCSLSAQLASAQFRSENELSYQRVQDRLERLEKELNTMQKQFYKNKKDSSSITKRLFGGGGNSAPKQSAQMMAVDEELRKLNGRIEEAEYRMNDLASKLDKIIADIDYRISAVEKQTTVNDHSLHKSPSSNQEQYNDDMAPISLEPQENDVVSSASQLGSDDSKKKDIEEEDVTAQYEHAFALLRQAKYDQAETALQRFINRNKTNSLVGNAYYWLGETYYVRDRYEEAAVNFLKGYQGFPEGNKVVDNLTKLAMSLARLGKKPEACTTFNEVLEKFPNAEADIKNNIKRERQSLDCS